MRYRVEMSFALDVDGDLPAMEDAVADAFAEAVCTLYPNIKAVIEEDGSVEVTQLDGAPTTIAVSVRPAEAKTRPAEVEEVEGEVVEAKNG